MNNNIIYLSLLVPLCVSANPRFIDSESTRNVAHTGARHLSLVTGRFLSQDDRKQYFSHYNYGVGDVIKLSDPTGYGTGSSSLQVIEKAESFLFSSEELEAARRIIEERIVAVNSADINKELEKEVQDVIETTPDVSINDPGEYSVNAQPNDNIQEYDSIEEYDSEDDIGYDGVFDSYYQHESDREVQNINKGNSLVKSEEYDGKIEPTQSPVVDYTRDGDVVDIKLKRKYYGLGEVGMVEEDVGMSSTKMVAIGLGVVTFSGTVGIAAYLALHEHDDAPPQPGPTPTP